VAGPAGIDVTGTVVPADVWNAIVDGSDEALAFHRREWVETVAEHTGGRDISRVYERHGRRVIVPLIRVGGWVGRAGVAASLPYGWGFGGVLAEGRVTDSDVRMVIDDLSGVGLTRVSLRPNPLAAAAWANGMPAGTPSVPRVAHVLPLDPSFEKVWTGRFTGTARTNVRRAEKSALTVEVSRTDDAIEAFYDLYQRSWARWGDQRRYAAATRWLIDRRRERVEKFRAAARALGTDLAIWLARSGETPVAAIVVLSQRGAASYWRGAMDDELAGPTRANYLLHKMAIEAACSAGATVYHMGDTGGSSSLAQFKTRFGAEPVEYREYHLERLPVTAAMKRVRRILG
jgi:hypothetical protein